MYYVYLQSGEEERLFFTMPVSVGRSELIPYGLYGECTMYMVLSICARIMPHYLLIYKQLLKKISQQFEIAMFSAVFTLLL